MRQRAVPHLQSMPSDLQKRADANAGALAASRRRHEFFRAERVLPAAERRLTVTPFGASACGGLGREAQLALFEVIQAI